ncbi:hypothetical protein ACKFKF_13310 [Phormidesmis sp. 146-12]
MTKRYLDRWIPDGATVVDIGVGVGHYSRVTRPIAVIENSSSEIMTIPPALRSSIALLISTIPTCF